MNEEQLLKLTDDIGDDVGESVATNAIKGLTEKAIGYIAELQEEKPAKQIQKTKNFDYSTLSKNKFSKGNTTPINLFNTLKEKGIIGFEVGDNDETLKATKTLLSGIDKKLVSDNLPGMLNTELDVATYGENFGEGFAKFIYGNSSNITAEEFETLANEIVAPLNNNGKLSAVSKYRDLITESDVTSEISKKMNMDFLDKIKGASSFLNDKDNEILKKIDNNEMISPEEAKQVQDAKDTIEDYKKFIKETATKYGVSEESVINKTPREIKSNLYNYNKTDKKFEFNNQKGAYSKIENIDFNTDTGEYIKRPVNNDTTTKDIFENLTKKQGYDELGDINSQNMKDVLKGLKDKIEDIENPHLKEYIDYADELGKKGISIGEDGEKLLKTYNSVLNNTTLNDQNKNAILKELDSISPNINQDIINGISKDNLKYLNSGLIDYKNGEFIANQKFLDYLNEDEIKEFESTIKSKNFGTENLSELNDRIDRNIFTDSIRKTTGNNNLTYEQIEKEVNSTITNLREGKLKTVEGIGLDSSEILESRGITGNNKKIILDTINNNENLSYNSSNGNVMKLLYQSNISNLSQEELDELYFGKVSDENLNYFSENKARTLMAESKIKNNPKELTEFLTTEDKKSLVEQHLKNKLGEEVFNNSQTPEFSESTMNDMIQEMDDNMISEKLSSKVEDIKNNIKDPVINLSSEEEKIISQMRNGNFDNLKGKTLEELNSLAKKGEQALFKKDKIQEFKKALNLETNADGIFGKGYSFKLRKDAFKDKDDFAKWISGLENNNADELRNAFGEKFELFEENFKVEDKGLLEKIIDFTKKGRKRYNGQGKTGFEQINDELANMAKEFGIIDEIDGKGMKGFFNKEAVKGLVDNDFENIKVLGSAERLKKNLNSSSTNNIIDNGKKLFGSKGGKTALGIAGIMAITGFVSSAVSNASEERRRKEMELNQLIMATNSGYRGAY